MQRQKQQHLCISAEPDASLTGSLLFRIQPIIIIIIYQLREVLIWKLY